LNCAALSEGLLESELFGHEKGAFTGATDRKIGKFEAADNGTLMLDEIGEMSPSIQAKFLRVLEGHPFERVGGSKAIKVDARVIAATNRDLEKAVTEGKFRRDLFFRLHVIEIDVPPLRKRPQDIIELAEHFLQRFNAETGRKFRGFMPSAIQQMRTYRWPGNVRELENEMQRALALAETGELITPRLLSDRVAGILEPIEAAARLDGTLHESMARIEGWLIRRSLERHGGRRAETARKLGITREGLYKKMKRLDIS
jgi:Nif-specific regulatory protein